VIQSVRAPCCRCPCEKCKEADEPLPKKSDDFFDVGPKRRAIKPKPSAPLAEKQSGPVLSDVPTISGPVDTFLGSRGSKSRPRSFTMGDSKWEKIVAALNVMLATGDFSRAEVPHAVALFERFHTEVYGIPPADLTSKERALACSVARRLLEKQLGGDMEALLEFVGWTWKDQRQKMKWLESTGNVLNFRISWFAQFSLRTLTDWRVKNHRHASGGR
jgi:hypothetical protein